MERVTDRLVAERTWVAAVGGVLVALVVGSLVFPEAVYDGFIWQYFWGPVQADANSAVCAVRSGGTTRYLFNAQACAAAPEPVAYPGYTLVSEVGYALTLLLALFGVVILLRRLGLGERPNLFFALVPFMFFGGALRVVEDANDAVPDGISAAISYPWNTLIISPIIYLTVFVVTLTALVSSIALARRGFIASYDRGLPAIGFGLLGLTLGYLSYLAFTTQYVSFHPQILLVVVVLTTIVTWGAWKGVQRYAPKINRGTGAMGLVILWSQTLDGVANVIGIDWARELGLPADLVPKHPVNRAIVSITEDLLPPVVAEITGTAWPFLVVKVVAAIVVIWVFDPEIFEESPRYAILLLIAIAAVGLGPGTRDVLRATFGV